MAYISRTTGTAFTSNKKCTISAWVKGPFPPSGDNHIWSIGSASGSTGNIFFYIQGSGAMTLYGYNPSLAKVTTRLFRDSAAWYHMMMTVDTTESVATDRTKLYVNGVQETDWGTDTNYSLNDTIDALTSGKVQYIGSNTGGVGPWKGEMSHVQYVDGLALAPTDFGEFDSTSGIWKIKTGAYATPGNNGYFLKMEDRTNLDLDSSSNAFTFTTTGDLTATYDNPSNNFCTIGPQMSPLKPIIYANGNTFAEADNIDVAACCTMGVTKGSWYMEAKATDTANTTIIGLVPAALINESYSGMGFDVGSANNALNVNPSVGLRYNGNIYEKVDGSQVSASSTSFTTGDIIGFAFNIDTGALRFWKNGVEITGSPYTLGDGSYASTNWLTAGPLLPAFRLDGGGVTILAGWECNFGNGYFGTTAVASTNADAAGIGSFEYAVPASHYALCTKNIKVYG